MSSINSKWADLRSHTLGGDRPVTSCLSHGLTATELKNPVRTAQKTNSLWVTNTNQLTLYSAINTIYAEKKKKQNFEC
jgi:hypothetical protein